MQRNWSRIWPWLPVAFAGAYVIVMLVRFSALITAVNMNSDAAVAPVIGQLLGSAPNGSQAILGNHPWYEPLLFLRATAGLPAHRQLWDVTPAAWFFAGIAILAWATWRAFGAWSAALVASALACAGEGARTMLFAFDFHGMALLHTIMLGALIVWLAGSAERLRAWQLASIAIGMGALSAAPVASDELFLYWGLLPMVLASGLLVWRTRSRAHWITLAVATTIVVIALVGGHLLNQALAEQGWISNHFPLTFVSPEAILNNFSLMVQSYSLLAGGSFFGTVPNFQDTVMLLSALLFLSALVLILVEVRRRTTHSTPAPVSLDARASRRFAHTAFWTGSLVCASGVFLLSSAPVDAAAGRYLLAGYVAVGALLPLLGLRGGGWQASVTAGVCTVALIACYQVAREAFQPPSTTPGPAQANALLHFAQSEHVSYGFANYWEAADLTWLTYFKAKIYPADECSPPNPTLCPFGIGEISSWYTPQPHTRSMLIVDGTQPGAIGAADPSLGPPAAGTTIGNMQVYVYDYDIASRFQGAP